MNTMHTFEWESSSSQNGKWPKRDALSDSEPENWEIESLLNVPTIEDAVDSVTYILCNKAQDYNLEVQCGSSMNNKLEAMLNKMARN